MLRIRRITGQSMLPTLSAGQIIVATRWVRLRPGKIVVAWVQDREVIKRVYAVSAAGITIHGDNPSSSTDSRHFGPIDPRDVLGVVIWPRQTKRRKIKIGKSSK